MNGQERDSRWKRTAGYVEQFDLMYGRLTVQETIQYAADFKLPANITPGEKRAVVDGVIGMLGLTGVRHSVVGEETKRGISGGEKKRVAIGIELVTFPGLLFLDEPTTGLDSTTAQSLIELLKGIAEKTLMTIVLTIHQPRASILTLFTRIIFMSQGRLIFNGTISACLAHIKTVLGLECPELENPADFVMDLLTVKAGDEGSRLRVKTLHEAWSEIEIEIRMRNEDDNQSINNEHFNNNLLTTTTSSTSSTSSSTTTTTVVINIPSSSSSESNQLQWPNNRGKEFGLLLKRNFILTWRNKLEIFATLCQTIILSLLLSFVFFQLNSDFEGVQGRLGLLFFIPINVLFTTVIPLLSIFALDRAVLLRERAGATYRVFPSFAAKFASLLPLSILFLGLFATPIYFIAGLTMPFSRYLVYMLMLTALKVAALGLGLWVASISPTVRISEIIGPLIIVIFLIFGGNLANSNEITWILRWIQYISLVFYTYQALAQNEFNGNYYGVQRSADIVPGSYYLNLYGLDNVNEWGCLGAILGLGLAFLILGYAGLRYSTRPQLTLKIKNMRT